MKTVIHVNQHVIKANAKNGTSDPVLTVKTHKSNEYCHEVEILGPSKVIYSPDKPLSCGAKVWIETNSEVRTRKMGDLVPEMKALKEKHPKLAKLTKQQKRNKLVLERLIKFSNEDNNTAKHLADALDNFLNDLCMDDFFGTETQMDPRGDGRNGHWTMKNVEE